MRVEHEYERLGTVAYLAAWDVHRARLFGRVERKSDIPAFGRLVDQFMSQEPYRSAGRVFRIVDNGTIHRGQRAVDRLRERWANLLLIHLPVHASWLNQMEIYFSIVKRCSRPMTSPLAKTSKTASCASKTTTRRSPPLSPEPSLATT
jgi:hypothetical protein